MREIHGYVCAAGQTLKGYTYLFGKNITTFGWDGFRPFQSLKKALKAQREIVTMRTRMIEPFVTARIMYISMRITESYEELFVFSKEPRLVVIAMFDKTLLLDGECEIVGPRIEGCYGCVNGVSEFQRNGFRQFTATHTTDWLDKTEHTRSAHENALYVLGEVNRQGQIPARLATCHCKWQGKQIRRK